MRHPSRLFSVLALTISVVTAADYGPAIGTKMPDFAAPDQDGQVRALPALLGPKGALLVFFRSADW